MKVSMMTEYLLKRGMTQEEAIRYAKDLGYDGIDVSLFTCMNDDDEMMRGDYLSHAKHLKDVCDEIGITPVQVHTPFPIYRDNDTEYNEKMIKVTKKCLEICGVMQIPVAVVHPWNNFTPEQNRDWYMNIYDVAEKNKVIIATENMWNWNYDKDCADYASCSTPEDFLANVKTMSKPYFKACVDVGHANMFYFDKTITPERMIRVLGHDYVCALHISDNNAHYDDHQIPFTGKINWDEVIKALKDINYQGNIDLELIAKKEMPDEVFKAYFKHALVTAEWIRKQLLQK